MRNNSETDSLVLLLGRLLRGALGDALARRLGFLEDGLGFLEDGHIFLRCDDPGTGVAGEVAGAVDLAVVLAGTRFERDPALLFGPRLLGDAIVQKGSFALQNARRGGHGGGGWGTRYARVERGSVRGQKQVHKFTL